MEILDKEFKKLMVKIVNELREDLREKMQGMRENFNKEIDVLKKNKKYSKCKTHLIK